MAIIDLPMPDWNQVMTIIGNTRDFPWSVTNPLLMKLGKQLELQTPSNNPSADKKNSEMPINIGEIGGVKQ